MRSLQELETFIGAPSGQQVGKVAVPPCLMEIAWWNKPAVQEWCKVKGLNPERVDKMWDASLLKCYNIPAYINALLTRGDYNPNVQRGGRRWKNHREPVYAPRSPSGYPSTPSTIINGATAVTHEPSNEPISHAHYTVNGASPEPVKVPYAEMCHEQFCFEPAVSGTSFCAKHTPALSTKPLPAPEPNLNAGAQLAALIGQLAQGAVNEARVIELIQAYAPAPETKVIERVVVIKGNEPVSVSDEPHHKQFANLLMMVDAGINVMLVGPAAAGKTKACAQVAEALSLPFSHIGAIGSRYELSGFIDAQGRYQRTAFRDAFENGGVFLWDEYDASDANAVLWGNTAIGNGLCAFPDGNVTRHPDFRLVACANTHARGADRMYAGRNAQDAAANDRFVDLTFGYDEKLERKVWGDNDWTSYVQAVRKAVKSLGIRIVVSPRATDFGKRLLERGMDRETVKAAVLWKGIESDQIAKIEAMAGR